LLRPRNSSPDQIAAGFSLLAKHEVSGHVALLPHLAVNAGGGDVIILESSVGWQVLGYYEKTHALHALRPVLLTGQQQVDHVFGGVVVAAADVDFLSLDPVAPVANFLVVGRDVRKGGAGLGFGQGHGALPLPQRHFFQVGGFQFIGAKGQDQVSCSGREEAVGRHIAVSRLEREASGVEDRKGHLLAVVFVGPGSTEPTALPHGPHALPYLGQYVYFSVFIVSLTLIHFPVHGKEVLIGQLFGGIKAHLGGVGIEILELLKGTQFFQVKHFVEDKTEVAG
jgi:hypothetical protein